MKNLSLELKNKNQLGSVILEKMQLLDNINTLSEEVDNLSAKNNILIDMIKCRENPRELSKIKKEIFVLQSENKAIKDILTNKNKDKTFDHDENRELTTHRIFSCLSRNEEEGFTVNLANNYKR